ncbi:cytochrome P450 [Penicillium longicatenatum]|uniref:cytochrome P450 n=1 Tax=Penicillium longicatenatum TaxID=1561947 RepID=UPI002547B847|nr:cytochrome P450 [Penicillium longicatenatum]KAJ5635151.1 cytochrome P450 [Penicillium longicatenatum]
MFQIQALLLVIGLVALLFLVAYRLTLHPLARVPGPFLAAATGAYEAYFQLAKEGGGRYWVEVARLHEVYGPIVRINPWEVHIKDPDWNDIYKLSSKACKPKWYYRSFGSTLSTNTTESDQLHRIYRQALTTWFSTQNITQSEPNVQATIDRLHDRLLASSGKIVNLGDVYRCLAIDVATGFAFQKAFGNLDDAHFSEDFNMAVRDYGRTGIFNRYLFGLPFKLLQSLPQFISRKLNPAVGTFMAMVSECAEYSMKKRPSSLDAAQDMVQSMIKADLSLEQKSFPRILAECRSIILAGQETTATVLTSVTYHALSNPEILSRLLKELTEARNAKGAKLEYQDIRYLPYLTAVINEALRTSNAVSGRLTRFSEVVDLHYQQYFLPRGTYISINLNDTHKDSSIFTDPEAFLPDRWLRESDHKQLLKYLQPWGRGARLCLGMELAYHDLYLSIARLFGPDCGFEMKLFETELEDWDAYGDFFAPMPAPRRKGMRVSIETKSKPVKP